MSFLKLLRKFFDGSDDSLPPGLARGPSGGLVPAPGYEWVSGAPGDFSVQWCPGKPLPGRNLVAGPRPGDVRPAPGYDWARAGDPCSGEVRWTPGKPHGESPHVIAASIEGKWATEPGWRWLNRESGDLRVVREDGHGAGTVSEQSVNGERLQRLRDLAALGLDELADIDEIEAAFRRLVMIHHPDHFHGRGGAAQEAAERAFRMLRGAYERLTAGGRP